MTDANSAPVQPERNVIITMNPIQAQSLIMALQQRIDTLRSGAELAVQPGVKGRMLKQAEQLEAVHMLCIQAYNEWIGEEGRDARSDKG